MLNEALDGLREGDVVVLSPEYDIVWRDEPNHLDIAEVLRFAPSAGRFVERRHWWPTLRSAVLVQPPVMLHDIAVNALRNVAPGLGSGGVYYRSAFNSYGDNRSGSQLESTYEPKAEELVAHVDEADYARNLEAIAAFATLGARARRCRSTTCLPPFPMIAMHSSRSVYERTAADIERKAGVTVVGTPVARVLPERVLLRIRATICAEMQSSPTPVGLPRGCCRRGRARRHSSRPIRGRAAMSLLSCCSCSRHSLWPSGLRLFCCFGSYDGAAGMCDVSHSISASDFQRLCHMPLARRSRRSHRTALAVTTALGYQDLSTPAAQPCHGDPSTQEPSARRMHRLCSLTAPLVMHLR